MLHVVSGKISADSPDWFSAVCYACKYRNIFASVLRDSRSRKAAVQQFEFLRRLTLRIERIVFDNHNSAAGICSPAGRELSFQSNRIAGRPKPCKVYRLRITGNTYRN